MQPKTDVPYFIWRSDSGDALPFAIRELEKLAGVQACEIPFNLEFDVEALKKFFEPEP